MSVVQCTACNGVYSTKQRDGMGYAHVCPPGTPPANVRNENPPDTSPASAAKIISAGLGTQAPAVIPPIMVGL